MSNERYLIISYFALAAVGLGLGVLVYYILRRPFGASLTRSLEKRAALFCSALSSSR